MWTTSLAANMEVLEKTIGISSRDESQPFRFLDLFAELRNTIFDIAFTCPKSDLWPGNRHATKGAARSPSSAWLLDP